MPAVHIRDLDQDVHDRLVRQAELEGVSCAEWIRAALAARARTPTVTEIRQRAEARRGNGETRTWEEFDAWMERRRSIRAGA